MHNDSEKRSYLFVPGKHGINPKYLNKEFGEHTIRAESGRKLVYIKNSSRLALFDPAVYDPQQNHIFQGILDAYMDGKSLRFVIYPSEPFFYLFNRRIPDLNSSGFFDLAIEHFSIHNENFQQIEASWNKDNGKTYAQYQKALKKTRRKDLAAYATWTGHQARRNGFVTTPEDITESIFLNEEAVIPAQPVKIVSAIFRRPK